MGHGRLLARSRLLLLVYSLFSPYRNYLGIASGLLRLRHWQSDALTTRLDLVHVVILTADLQKRLERKNRYYGNRFVLLLKLPSGWSVAQLVVRWLAVRQARVRISARHPMEIPPTESTAVKIWRWACWMNVMYEWINYITNICKKSGIRPPNLYEVTVPLVS